MKAEGVWRRDGSVLVPWSSEARTIITTLAPGGMCSGQLWIDRNPRQLAYYWALVNLVAEATGELPDRISDWIKIKLNIYSPYIDPVGRLQIEIGSLSPRTMDAVDFTAFMDRAIVLLAERIGAAPKDLRREWNLKIRTYA
jgi:hypothetical protein